MSREQPTRHSDDRCGEPDPEPEPGYPVEAGRARRRELLRLAEEMEGAAHLAEVDPYKPVTRYDAAAWAERLRKIAEPSDGKRIDPRDVRL